MTDEHPEHEHQRGLARGIAQGWLIFGAMTFALLWFAPDLVRFLEDTDHGWQLGIGRQILLGSFPDIDLFFHYGPLVGYASALVLWLAGNLIGEVVLCSLGYGTALFLMHRIARRWASSIAGWIVPLAGFLLLARFYKWYYWLFPVAVLYSYHRYLDGGRERSRWLLIGGLIAGAGGLFRHDLGLVFAIFIPSLLLAESWHLKRWLVSRAACFFAGLAVPLLIWLAVLAVAGGTGAVRDYFVATLVGSTGYAENWAVPIRFFDWTDPFSLRSIQSGLFVGQAMFFVTCVACTLIGGLGGFLRRSTGGGRYHLMTAVGVLGIGLSPQGFVRADVHHLLQILPMYLLGAAVLLCWGWKRPQALVRGGTLAYAALLVLAVAGVQRKARFGLAPLMANPIKKYELLQKDIQAVSTSVEFIAKLREAVPPGEYLLVLPFFPQLHYFSERQLSGIVIGYPEGVFDDEEWRLRNMQHVEQHPPAAIVIRRGSFAKNHSFRLSQPELAQYLVPRYKQVVSRYGPWLILTPENGTRR